MPSIRLSSLLLLLLGACSLHLASAQQSPCIPQWTVSFDLIGGQDTVALALVMDTSATFGLDEGLDVLCQSNPSVIQACLIEDSLSFQTNHVPSDADSAIHWMMYITIGDSAASLFTHLGDFPLDSASVSWGDSTAIFVQDLLVDNVIQIPDTLDSILLHGVLVPDCSIPGCTDEAACNYNPEATEDDGSCDLPFFCFDCDGNCLCDQDMDGVCDPFEFPGCTDPNACNWAPVYTEEDGSCYYAQDGFDCNGFCLPVTNDECSLAEPIACSQVITATTVCADTTESQYCSQFNIGEYYHGGLWYSIVGTGDTLRATMCFENTGYDTYLSVYEGECGNLNCVAGNDDQDEADSFAQPCSEYFFASAVNWKSEAGVEYLLHVSGSNAVTPAVGGFDFVLICDSVAVGGCLDPLACNYNGFVTFDDGSCDYSTCAGCGLASACNFDSTAFINDFSLCDFTCYGCTDPGACNFSPDATIESGLCEYSSCAGCLNPDACNYDPEATIDAEDCEYTSCVGCTDETASNFNDLATVEDGSCTYCDLTLSLSSVTTESCFGANDGLAEFLVDSALTDSVTYTLSGPELELTGAWVAEPFDSLAPGTFVLEVLDGDSTCGAVEVFTIEAAPDPALFLVASAPECSGGEDGNISAFVADTVTVTGFALNGVAADIGGNFLGLSAGDYAVEVTVQLTSGATCTDTASIAVVDPPGMTVVVDSIEGANPGEENGEVLVTVTGGAEPYDFVWTGPTGISGQEDPDDLGGGEWTLTVTDDDGCSVTVTVDVPVGMAEQMGISMSASPNPVRQALHVAFDAHFEGQLILRDGAGRRVDHVSVSGQAMDWDVSRHPSGVYTLYAQAGTGDGSVLRLVIVH